MSPRRRRRTVVRSPSPQEFETPEGTISKSWMIIFSDLISLMLTFFVLLFSMSDMNLDNWNEITDTLSRSLSPTIIEEEPVLKSSEFNISTVLRENATDIDYLSGVMTELLSNDEVLGGSRVLRLDDRLVVALPSDALFEESGAVLTENAWDAVFKLSGVLRNVANQIGVNGHSDPVPPNSAIFTSNWELSIARATAVSNLLRQSGVNQDIAAYGFSDSRYDELPDLPEDERATMARRVDIVIFPTGGEL
ncbi:MAG: OmpA family protein [Rhodospirillales bacterium]|jgi:chemotaxis protein MotB|nr:OmpA family protein [Rhodospirillales bacterium]MBT4039435.1 OmpA family protein [Rhodospirillales bacterium]MBT4626577.1 OmpA family protein [Rhodospirillales bacterium]MBT5352431.1 OmpA family protein [Rhodospirillales bacterium]MBT5520445.1 OmpA family protein [Rhodospirillales bacterium]